MLVRHDRKIQRFVSLLVIGLEGFKMRRLRKKVSGTERHRIKIGASQIGSWAVSTSNRNANADMRYWVM